MNKMTVIGWKSMKGISKRTNKSYDCTLVYGIIKNAYGVTGEACDVVWLDAKEHPGESLEIGATYAVERTRKGYVISFDKLA